MSALERTAQRYWRASVRLLREKDDDVSYWIVNLTASFRGDEHASLARAASSTLTAREKRQRSGLHRFDADVIYINGGAT